MIIIKSLAKSIEIARDSRINVYEHNPAELYLFRKNCVLFFCYEFPVDHPTMDRKEKIHRATV